MKVSTRRLRADVTAALQGGPVTAAGEDDVRAAARFLGEVVRREGRLIEIEPHDVLQLLGEWAADEVEVRWLEATGPRAHPPDLADWLSGVRSAFIEVLGGPDLTLVEVAGLADHVYAQLPGDVEAVFGAGVSEGLAGQVTVRLVGLLPAA